MTSPQTLKFFDTCYGVLMLLYPTRFRIRFGDEMLQLFQDCCRAEIDRHGLPGLCRLSFRTSRDFAVSLMHEWRREWVLIQPRIDYTGLMDSFLITVVVGTNLLGWGWLTAVFVLNITTPRLFEYYYSLATILAVVVTISMAALIGIISAAIVSRAGRPERNRISV